MKQIQECLDRFFDTNKGPLKRKWQALLNGPHHLHLYHYHHLILVYDLENHEIQYEWWEKPADKRGLDAAKEYLERRFKPYPSPYE